MGGRGHTEVADDVPCGVILLGELRSASDLVEQGGRRELEAASEEIQTATMRHTNDDMLDSRCEATYCLSHGPSAS